MKKYLLTTAIISLLSINESYGSADLTVEQIKEDPSLKNVLSNEPLAKSQE